MAVQVSITWHPSRAPGRKPTVHEALRATLQREPTHAELCADVRRILDAGLVERATAGKLRHQRR